MISRHCLAQGKKVHRLTSPPPITSTRLLRICHASISEPPPSTGGKPSGIVRSVRYATTRANARGQTRQRFVEHSLRNTLSEFRQVPPPLDGGCCCPHEAVSCLNSMKPRATCLHGSLGEEEYWVVGGLSHQHILRGTRAYSLQPPALCLSVPPLNLQRMPRT